MSNILLKHMDARGVLTLTLNRPEIMNAFDDSLISELDNAFSEIEKNESVRIVILTGKGKAFSAGADFNWMKKMSSLSREKNINDAMIFSKMLSRLNSLTIPTIAKVNGATYGGGVGLVAACDVAIGAKNAKFCLSEVRIGLIPAVISPYVISAIGSSNARYLFLTAMPITSAKAASIGLLNDYVEEKELDVYLEKIISSILKGGKNALSLSKELIFAVEGKEIDSMLLSDTAERIADARASEEGKEGVDAFLNKRNPSWLEK